MSLTTTKILPLKAIAAPTGHTETGLSRQQHHTEALQIWQTLRRLRKARRRLLPLELRSKLLRSSEASIAVAWMEFQICDKVITLQKP